MQLEDLVIGYFILNPDKFRDTNLESNDFKYSYTKNIFDKMFELHSEGLEINLVNLYPRLEGKAKTSVYTLPDNCQAEYFGTLEDLEKSLLAENKKLLVKRVIEAHGTDDPEKVAQALYDGLAGKPIEHTVSEDLNALYTEIESLSENPEAAGIMTGIPSLDEYLCGLKPGYVYIIAARPSQGKSCFSLNIALHAAAKGKRVYIQALEETRRDIYRRMTSHISSIDLYRISTGRIQGNEWPKITQAHNTIKSYNMHIDDESGLTSVKIAQRIRRAHSKSPLDLVIVDHLQEIYNQAQSRHMAISIALHDIKAVCKNLGIPCIVLSQLNRGVEQRKTPEPYMSDLKESGDVEAKADVVMLIYRPGYYDVNIPQSEMLVGIAKSRNGRVGKIKLHFDGGKMKVFDAS